MELKGKNVLVTGAAHRVGKAIALRLAQEGCNVAIHYHAALEAARKTLSEIQTLPVQAEIYQADLRDLHGIQTLFSAVAEDFKRLDILINSAAIMERTPFQMVTPENWEATVNLNLRAAFFCIQSAAHLMGPSGGVVVNISDIAGLQPWADFPVHSISKAGVEMLTKVAALAYAPKLRVNAIAPGPVFKPEHMSQERWEAIGARLPLGAPGEPADVSEAVVFLIKNDMINGETIAVDGGNQII